MTEKEHFWGSCKSCKALSQKYVINALNIHILIFERFFGVCGGKNRLSSGCTAWLETVALSILASTCCLKCFSCE